MVTKCFKCNEIITFDETILSKNGKKIPLWPDKQDAHGHDEQGKPIRSPLEQTPPPPPPRSQPPSSYQQQQQQTTIDRPSMEAILLSQVSQKLEQLKSFVEGAINEKITACYQLSKSNNDMLGAITQYYKMNEPQKASELYQAMQHTKEEALKPEEEGEIKQEQEVL